VSRASTCARVRHTTRLIPTVTKCHNAAPNSTAGTHLGVVSRVGECEGEHALLLQVGLVDAGEGPHDDGAAAEMPGLQRCTTNLRCRKNKRKEQNEQNEPRQLTSVLSAGAFAVVLVTDNNPFEAGSLRAN
jgi:hypothetical protein